MIDADKIRKAPLRKILALWAAGLTTFVILFHLFTMTAPPDQIKDIIIYVVSATIGAYFASSSFEAIKGGPNKGGKCTYGGDANVEENKEDA